MSYIYIDQHHPKQIEIHTPIYKTLLVGSLINSLHYMS